MPKLKVTMLYSGIRVRNVRRSLAFYRKLGFKIHRRGKMEHGGVWVHLSFPGSKHDIELNYYPPRNRFYEAWRNGTEFDHFGFWVSDVAGWTRSLRRKAIPIVSEFSESNSSLVYIRDPDGNWLEFFGPRVRTASA
jgi:catechol 2,3-dioxygenase-like lactoylglutathione lyase family enzyme